jgi:hypothetical protein
VLRSILFLGSLAVINAWLAYISLHRHPVMAFGNGVLSLLLALAAFVLLSERDRLRAGKG